MMTEKQKRFCDEYLIDGNAKQAAIRAGYSPRTAVDIGHENLKKPELKKYIDERLEQLQSEKVASIQEVLEYLTAVMRGETESEIVVTVKTGFGNSQIVRFKKHPDQAERLKAAEMLGRRYGLFKGDVTATVEQVVIINDLVPDDW